MGNPKNPYIPTDEQLDLIRDEMQAVCDAWSGFNTAIEELYTACAEADVSDAFIEAAIDAVKDDRSGEDADEAFALAKEEV